MLFDNLEQYAVEILYFTLLLLLLLLAGASELYKYAVELPMYIIHKFSAKLLDGAKKLLLTMHHTKFYNSPILNTLVANEQNLFC